MRTIKEMYFMHRIHRNQRKFLRMERRVALEKDHKKQCVLAKNAADFAVRHTTDIFSSSILEKPFIELANKIKTHPCDKYIAKTTLHVMTEAYTSGGHTRCVERWAQQMKKYKHSCVLLRQNSDIPEQLREIMEKSGGELIVFNKNETIVQSAIRLREIASKYENIVLHIHMNDPIALIAFGTKEFKRPIIFFNHADHAFWLGVSISDWVADLNCNRNKLTLDVRGAKHASVLGIPADNSKRLKISKQAAREKLKLPKNKKIIFSSGQPTKYDPLGHPDFSDIISDLIDSDRDIVFYVAGATKKTIFWPKLLKKYPNNLFLPGRLDYATEYPLYLAAADLVIDSIPVGGETAMIDAVRAGKPVLTLNKLVQADFMVTSNACCKTYDELLDKSHKILNNKKYADDIYHDVNSRFLAETDLTNWSNRCESIIKKLPKHHKIYDFKSAAPMRDITEYSWSTTRWTEPVSSIFSISRIRKWMFQIHINKNETLVRLFGFNLINKTGATNDKCTKDFAI